MAKYKKVSSQLTTLENLLSYKYITNSYKLFWYRSLISTSNDKKNKVSIHDLGLNMIVHAWELVAVKEITFGRLDKLHRVIELILDQYHFPTTSTIEEVKAFLPTIKDKEILELIEEISEEACHEFIAPLYEQKLKKVNFNKRYTTVATLSLENATAPYSIHSEKNSIQIHPEWSAYFTKNTKEALNLFHDSLAFFLDRHAMSKK